MSKYGVFSGPYFPVFGLNAESYSVKNPENAENAENVEYHGY